MIIRRYTISGRNMKYLGQYIKVWALIPMPNKTDLMITEAAVSRVASVSPSATGELIPARGS